ncbi:MAG: glycosyltransferase family 4 protein [Candidatus Goldbacteria bacterium]|nr:glycosyltransferase family 4 protein [Candidatus Goldiibacteriota bacterium]
MKKQAKILFIATGYGDSPVISGGEVRLFNIVKHLSGKITPDFLTTSGGINAADAYGITGYFHGMITVKNRFMGIRETFGFQRLIGYFVSAFDADKKLRTKKYSAIYTSSDCYSDIYPSYKYKSLNPASKWFCMLHHKYDSPFKRAGFFPVNAVLYLLQLHSFKMIAKRADCVFVLDTDAGTEITKTLLKYGYKGLIHRVKNGINKIPAAKIKKDRSMAVFLGGLRPSKGLYDIVPVWKKVSQKNPELKLTVAGKGSDKDMAYLKEAVEKNGLTGAVSIAGYIDTKNLNTLLSKAAVFFLPSREEGWGISILEALQHGCKPVVYDLPAFKVFKNHVIRIPRFDHELYAEEILKTFKSKTPAAINTKFISQFYWNDIAKHEFLIINRLLSLK